MTAVVEALDCGFLVSGCQKCLGTQTRVGSIAAGMAQGIATSSRDRPPGTSPEHLHKVLLMHGIL